MNAPLETPSTPPEQPLSFADAATALRAAKLNYRQMLVVSFEGNTFLADPVTILWLKDKFVADEAGSVPDYEGLPCMVQNVPSLLRRLERQRETADAWYQTATKTAIESLSLEMTIKYQVKEDHED